MTFFISQNVLHFGARMNSIQNRVIPVVKLNTCHGLMVPRVEETCGASRVNAHQRITSSQYMGVGESLNREGIVLVPVGVGYKCLCGSVIILRRPMEGLTAWDQVIITNLVMFIVAQNILLISGRLNVLSLMGTVKDYMAWTTMFDGFPNMVPVRAITL